MHKTISVLAVVLVLAAAAAAGAAAVGKTNRTGTKAPASGSQEALRPGVWPVAAGARPVVLDLAGQRLGRWTTAPTVSGTLAEWGFAPSPLDRIAPAPGTTLVADAAVHITQVQELVTNRRVPLPYQTTTQSDPSLFAGFSHPVSYGQDGLALERIVTTYVNGKAAASQILSQRVLKPPVNAVLAVGTLHVLYRGGSPLRFSKALNMISTGYYPSPTWSNGYTATGIRATFGIVAVDPSVIPLGSRLYIPGYGYALAADTGGAIVGNRIDLCFDSEQQALDWGVREMRVYVLSWG